MLYKFNEKSLKYDDVTGKVILIVIFIISTGLLSMTLVTVNKANDIRYITEETKQIIIKQGNEFSPEKLKEYILELNIRFPHIVYAQAVLESGEFKSNIFKENSNLFGMKCAKIRPTTNKGENRGHAYFETWKDCVVDYGFYSARFLGDIKTENEYFQYLGQNYAEDPNYVSKLKKIIEKNNSLEK